MTFEAGLYTHLTGVSALTALVSTRIYPGSAPTSAEMPYITYAVVSGNHEHHMTAASGLVNHLIQFDVWASSYLTLAPAADELRKSMDGFNGGQMGTVEVRSAMLQDEADEFVPATDASQEGVHRRRMDFSIWHTETVPTFS